jgi:hypothetical protein
MRIISRLFGPPDCCPRLTASMPIADMPNRPPVTQPSAPPPPNRLYINAIAAAPVSIGNAISMPAQPRPLGCGSSGGESRTMSPDGYSGSGRRVGRRMTTVLIGLPFCISFTLAADLACDDSCVVSRMFASELVVI